MRAALCYAFILVAFSATASASEFVQTHCSADSSGNVFLRLKAADRRLRTLSFSPSTVMFKGTTFHDLKWVADYNSFKEFSLSRSGPKVATGELVLTARDENSKEIGTIDLACWRLIVKAVNNAVPTHINNGA